MQVTLPVVNSIHICMTSAILLMLSMPAQADLPKATMDDYVWKVLDPTRNSKYPIEAYRYFFMMRCLLLTANLTLIFHYMIMTKRDNCCTC